jgi:hypothetical protein
MTEPESNPAFQVQADVRGPWRRYLDALAPLRPSLHRTPALSQPVIHRTDQADASRAIRPTSPAVRHNRYVAATATNTRPAVIPVQNP